MTLRFFSIPFITSSFRNFWTPWYILDVNWKLISEYYSCVVRSGFQIWEWLTLWSSDLRLRHWISNLEIPGSKPLGSTKVEPIFHFSEVNQTVPALNSKKLSASSGSAALTQPQIINVSISESNNNNNNNSNNNKSGRREKSKQMIMHRQYSCVFRDLQFLNPSVRGVFRPLTNT